jgi:hypothetical protein
MRKVGWPFEHPLVAIELDGSDSFLGERKNDEGLRWIWIGPWEEMLFGAAR